MEMENLKALVYGHNLNVYQKMLARREFEAIYELKVELMKTKKDIADDIIEKHYKTINWDDGCIDTLRKNILKGLEEYAKQQINLDTDFHCAEYGIHNGICPNCNK